MTGICTIFAGIQVVKESESIGITFMIYDENVY